MELLLQEADKKKLQIIDVTPADELDEPAHNYHFAVG